MSRTASVAIALLTFFSCLPGHAQLKLSSLTANNTSACPAGGPLPRHCQGPFPGQRDARALVATPVFDPPAANVSDEDIHRYLNHGSETKIFANFMLGFCTKTDSASCHNNVLTGYNSDDAYTVAAQAEDLRRRHIDGAIMTWEGNGTMEDGATLKFQRYVNALHCSGPQHCDPMYFLMYDGPAMTYDVSSTGIPGTSGAGCTHKSGAEYEDCVVAHIRNDMCYMNGAHWGNDAYLKQDGRPIVQIFPAEGVIPSSGPAPSWADVWARVEDWDRDLPGNCGKAPYNAKNGVPLIVFEDARGFTHSASSGSFYWIKLAGTDPATQYIFNIEPPATSETLDYFFRTALAHPRELVWSAGYKGFNSAKSAWGTNRIMDQACGQVWIASLTASNKYYPDSALPNLQLVTWNDYNEGTEIESGIDNCYTVTAKVSGTTIDWSLSPNSRFASLATVSHVEIYDSTDGENLRLLAEIPAASAGTWNLTKLSRGKHRLFVRMVGKNSILNRLSPEVAFSN